MGLGLGGGVFLVLGFFQHAFPKFLFVQVPNSVIAERQLWQITFFFFIRRFRRDYYIDLEVCHYFHEV